MSKFGGGVVVARDRKGIDFQTAVGTLLRNADSYHASFYAAPKFVGPSLYFHRRALETVNGPEVRVGLEHIYATLVSWGMHRMGDGGSKMKPFEEFAKAVLSLKDSITLAQGFKHDAMTEDKWSVVENVFKTIEVMATGTRLVGNSKVMAHLMPNIVPPIDREYTLKFLRGHKSINNDTAREWLLMRSIIEQLFIPVATDPEFRVKAQIWMGRTTEFPWDTSTFKIIDNLIIGAMQQRKADKIPK